MLVFVEGGKPEYPEKNPRSRDENQQQTQPTYDVNTGNRTQATLVGDKCSHHCAIPAPQNFEHASGSTEKLVKLDHLCSTSFSVWCKMLTIFAVHYIITGHPLIRILTALRANLRDTRTSSKVELNPRVSDATPRAPRPSVPSHAPLMQPSVSRRAVIVVEG